MDRVSSFLQSVLHKRGLREHAEGSLAVLRAQQWLSEQLPACASLVSVQSVEDGELLIACGHSAAMQECKAVEQELLSELARDEHCGNIRSIRIIRQ